MQIRRWLDELQEARQKTLPSKRPPIGAHVARVALAMGTKPHRLPYLLRKERGNGSRPVKPTPRGREALRRRKLEARLREQERQGYVP